MVDDYTQVNKEINPSSYGPNIPHSHTPTLPRSHTLSMFHPCTVRFVFLFLEDFVEVVKIPTVGNAGSGTVHDMVSDRNVVIGVAVKESEHHAAVLRQFPFCGYVGKELHRCIGHLLRCKSYIECTAYVKGEAFVHETFNHGKIEIGPVVICGTGLRCRGRF